MLVALLLLGACSRDSKLEHVPLDGTPRYPDVEGIVQEVDFSHVKLNDGKSYKVTREVQSFATQTMKALPLLQRKGQYVQLGVDGGTVAWIAAVGSVVPGDEPTVYYTGTLVRVSSGRAIFRDGTVLRLGKGVTPPVKAGFVIAEIDPDQRVVRKVAVP